MNAQEQQQLERLLNELVDSAPTDASEQQLAEMLRRDPTARRQYRQFMALHADLQWDYAVAAVSQPETVTRSLRKGRSQEFSVKRWITSGRAAVAALLLLTVCGGVFFLWLRQRDAGGGQPVIGHVVPLSGDVQLGVDGEERIIRRLTPLRAGTAIHVVGLTGLAVLQFDDGTELSFAGETHVTCDRLDGRITIHLREGSLGAKVVTQPARRPLRICTANAEISVLGTRLAVSADDEVSELGVQSGRVQLKRLADGETIDVGSGEYAMVSRRAALEAVPWPTTSRTWSEDFEDGLPDDWRYGQWLREGPAEGGRGVVRAARRFALDGSDSDLHRITLPRQWMQGLWRLEDDTVLHFTYKMTRPGWFHIMMGVRSDDLNPAHIGNYELQSNYWDTQPADQWRTVSVPFFAFRKNIRSVSYGELPRTPPRAGDVVYLLWFNTGDVDRGLVIDRIWVDRAGTPSR